MLAVNPMSVTRFWDGVSAADSDLAVPQLDAEAPETDGEAA